MNSSQHSRVSWLAYPRPRSLLGLSSADTWGQQLFAEGRLSHCRMPCSFPHLPPTRCPWRPHPQERQPKMSPDPAYSSWGTQAPVRGRCPASFSLCLWAGVRSLYFSATHCFLHRKCRLHPETGQWAWTQAQALCAPGSRPAFCRLCGI